MPELPSKIELLLQRMVELPEGLQFIVFLPGGRCDAALSGTKPRAVNYQSIDVLIRLHGLDGLGHTPRRQVEIWETRIAPVAKFFSELGKAEPFEADGSPSSLTRVILDVEVGGLFYATVGGHGWVFAATLDQQPLNSGMAEKRLIATVKKLENLLNKSSGL